MNIRNYTDWNPPTTSPAHGLLRRLYFLGRRVLGLRYRPCLWLNCRGLRRTADHFCPVCGRSDPSLADPTDLHRWLDGLSRQPAEPADQHPDR